MFLVIVTAFRCSSHPFYFGSQKERRDHNMMKEHSSQDTVTLCSLWLRKGAQSCLSNLTCRAVDLVPSFVAVFLTLSFALDPGICFR